MGFDISSPAIGTGGAPSGAAGGDLAGTYPNPTIKSSVTLTGHPTIEGVTSTGATGTGKIVYDGTPTLVTPVIGAAKATSLDISGATPVVAALHVGIGVSVQGTVGAAGAASAPPASPETYLLVNVGGTNYAVPCYLAS